jgi:hypothetical protein
MEIVISLYELTFWAAIVFTAIGAFLGLLGVWVKSFWNTELAPKLIITDLILAGSAFAIAAITKWLG